MVPKLIRASLENVYDIYDLALSYYQQQEHERALGILNKEQTLNSSVRCRYLAALCSVSVVISFKKKFD